MTSKTKFLRQILITVAVIALLSSCSTINRSMREPDTRVNLRMSDFSLSNQVTATATSVKVIGIDWARLFKKKTGVVDGSRSSTINLVCIPVIGNIVSDRTANYSLYELMSDSPGYDVVFYPQYETKILRPVLGIGFFSKITTVKTTARLGKMNN
ncbi:MAG: hypothetical protein CVU13_07135 [Bacteroidetes bacterium HGW-Bacteroidetes-8]|jgi:uncharacterized protein YceK|nr:MAG: hypothetical protein CVU13_07135 [Bacteroidetes bacterium HGW-Bacteroidetes-8]